jgi:hypothetical protein
MSSAEDVDGRRRSNGIKILNSQSMHHLFSAIEGYFVNIAQLALKQKENLFSIKSCMRSDKDTFIANSRQGLAYGEEAFTISVIDIFVNDKAFAED